MLSLTFISQKDWELCLKVNFLKHRASGLKVSFRCKFQSNEKRTSNLQLVKAF